MLAYLKLLMKNRLLSLKPMPSKNVGTGRIKHIFTLVGILLLVLTLYGMIVALEYFVFQGFVAIQNPQGILAAVFLLCILLTLFTSLFHVFYLLFFAKDISFVSALPISSRGILGAKMFMVVLGEAGIAFLICLPAMILYGMHTGAGLWFYVKALLFVPLLPVVPLAIVTLLSFGLIRVSALWKRREGVTTIATFVLVTGILAAQMSFSMYMQQQGAEGLVWAFLLQHLDIVNIVARFFPPIQWLCWIFLAPGLAGWIYGLRIAIVSWGLIALLLYVLGGGYQALAIRQSEVLARLNAQGKRGKRSQGVRSPYCAMYQRELKEIFTVPAYAANCLSPMVMFPIMLIAGMLGLNQQSAGLSILLLSLNSIPRATYLALAAAGLSLTGSMNMAVSTAVSREGKRHSFHRTLPVAPKTQLLAKLGMGMTLNAFNALTVSIVLWVAFPALWMETLVALPIAMIYSVMVCTTGLLMDAKWPRFHWKSETEAVKRNTNGVYAMLFSVLALCLLVGFFLLLQFWGLPAMWSLATVVALMLGIDGLLLLLLTSYAPKTYCLQERFN